jgi:cytosine/uracil/thiamine/allantoin permease
MFGAFAFTAIGVYYMLTNMSQTDWVMTVSGPLLIIGMTFLVDWIMRRTGSG